MGFISIPHHVRTRCYLEANAHEEHSGVRFSVPHQRIKEAKTCVSKMKEDLLRDSQSKYVITPDELHRKNTDPFFPVANQEILEQLLTRRNFRG